MLKLVVDLKSSTWADVIAKGNICLYSQHCHSVSYFEDRSIISDAWVSFLQGMPPCIL